MNASSQRLCAWGGLGFILMWLFGFWVFAGFIPLPTPTTTAGAVQEFYRAHTNSIRFGLMLTTTGSALLAPFIGVISVQLRRIEGRNSPLAQTQLALGAILVLEFIYPVFVMQAIAFRPDRPDAVVLAMYDVAWMTFIGVVSTAALQMIVIGVAILKDRRDEPILPRWLGYLSAWVGLLFCPGSVLVFFHNGPFAWNGIFAWWIPVVVFVIWIASMTAMLLKAVSRQEREDGAYLQDQIEPGGEVERELRSELRTLSAELAELRTRVLAPGPAAPAD
jgi:hypothetical protein